MYKAAINANRTADIRMYDQSLVNQYLDTSMALIGANASALLAAAANNPNLSSVGIGVGGCMHPLIYQKKRHSLLSNDESAAALATATAQLLLISRNSAELANKMAAVLPQPNQEVYDDIDTTFDANNKSSAALINNNSKVNEYCYIPASGVLTAASRPITIV